MTLNEIFKAKDIILLDGAVGTEMEFRGYQTSLPLWSASATFDAPQLLLEIYDAYIRAGCDIITANTFRSSRYTLAKAGLTSESPRYTSEGISLAKQAAYNADRTVLVAGSIAPLEDCYTPDVMPSSDVVREEYHYTVGLMKEFSVDLCIAETMINRTESLILAEELAKASIPFMISFTANADGTLLDGTDLADMVQQVLGYAPAAVLLNCRQPEVLTRNMKILKGACGAVPYGGYGNARGKEGGPTGMIWSRDEQSDSEYTDEAAKWITLGARVIGGCCGTTPNTMKRVKDLVIATDLQ